MLRHENICPHIERMFVPSSIDGFKQPSSASIFSQERLPSKTGEGTRMSVTGLVVPLAGFSMDHRFVCRVPDVEGQANINFVGIKKLRDAPAHMPTQGRGHGTQQTYRAPQNGMSSKSGDGR